jgi:hypothetical protein
VVIGTASFWGSKKDFHHGMRSLAGWLIMRSLAREEKGFPQFLRAKSTAI